MADRKVRWGIVSTANIGMNQVTPGIMKSRAFRGCRAGVPRSRQGEGGARRARPAAAPAPTARMRRCSPTPISTRSTIPLPNHLHVPVTLAAARAGKHVLCEKPIAITAAEAAQLRDAPKDILIHEAFMVRYHPQWHRAREIVRSGELGRVHLVRGAFLYFNDDPHQCPQPRRHRRRRPARHRLLLRHRRPLSVRGRAEARRGARSIATRSFKTDRLASVIADFGNGRQLTFVCGTQSSGRQTVEAIGPKGSLEIVIPFNAPAGQKTAIIAGSGGPMDRSLHPPRDHSSHRPVHRAGRDLCARRAGPGRPALWRRGCDQPDAGARRDLPQREIRRLGERGNERAPSTSLGAPRWSPALPAASVAPSRWRLQMPAPTWRSACATRPPMPGLVNGDRGQGPQGPAAADGRARPQAGLRGDRCGHRRLRQARHPRQQRRRRCRRAADRGLCRGRL